MTARYLLTVADADAARLERWLGGALFVASADPGESFTVPVAGLDAVTDAECEAIAARLRTSGPLYHAGGPTGAASARPALPELFWAPYREFGVPDPAAESHEPPAAPFTVGAVGYRGNDITVYWTAAPSPADPAAAERWALEHTPPDEHDVVDFGLTDLLKAAYLAGARGERLCPGSRRTR